MKSTQTYRTLVIDDDPAIHELFGTLLGPQSFDSSRASGTDSGRFTPSEPTESFPVFEIDSAYEGEQGLSFVRKALVDQRPYTMAFVDLRMKRGWGGIETISHIWRECFDLQVVICTGHADFTWHGIIKQFGHSDRLLILKKPFDLTEVRQMAYSLAEKWNLAREAQSHLERLQKLVTQRTAKLEEANLSLRRKIFENTRAERRLLTQYAVSQILAESTSFADATDRVFKIVCEHLDWDWGIMWIVDHESNSLQLANWWHSPSASFDAIETLHSQARHGPSGLPGEVWAKGQPVWLQDLSNDPAFRAGGGALEDGIHGALAFPIRAGGRIFGIMEFLSHEIRESDGELSQTFAVIGSSIGQFLERKQAEADLRKQRDYIDRLIKEIPDLVVGIAPDGRTTFVNPSVSNCTGYAPEEMIGQHWWQLLYPGADYEQVHRFFRHLEQGPVHDFEMILTTRQKQKRIVSWNSMTKLDEAGRLTEIIGFGNDITERHQAERERQSMEVQLRQAQKLESIGQLAAGIAHEINTPTQYIGDNIRFLQSSFAELNGLHRQYGRLVESLRTNAPAESLIAETETAAAKADLPFLLAEIPQAIQQSLDGVDRVARIVRAMKDFSHPGTGEKTPIDLNKAIDTALAVSRHEWKYVAEAVTRFDETLPPTLGFPGEINQVLLNLIVNAAHAIGDVHNHAQIKGTITITTQRKGDWAEIRVQDTGSGIPEKIRDKIFDPFFTTKPVGKGTGQGLAIARACIVEKHGGTISFETELGKGSTFIVNLPLRQAA